MGKYKVKSLHRANWGVTFVWGGGGFTVGIHHAYRYRYRSRRLERIGWSYPAR